MTEEERRESQNQLSKFRACFQALEGILIYRGNHLIRRLECPFGEEREGSFTVHAIVSAFQSRSQTTLDKTVSPFLTYLP